jgi:hypothetical protein
MDPWGYRAQQLDRRDALRDALAPPHPAFGLRRFFVGGRRGARAIHRQEP